MAMAAGAAAAVVMVSLASSAWQMAPGKASVPGLGAAEKSAVLIGFSNAFVPNFGVLNEGGLLQHYLQRDLGFAMFLGSLGLALSWPRRKALLAYVMLAGGLVVICIFVYSGLRWHHGLYFIFMLASLWLAGGPAPEGVRRHFLSVVLGIHMVVGLYALGSDLIRPYSDGRLAAHFLLEQHLDQLPLVGMNVLQDSRDTMYQWEIDAIQPVMLELGNRRIYDPIARSFESFFTHYAFRDYYPVMSGAETDRELRNVASRLGGPFVVVVLRHSSPDVPMDVPARLRKLMDFPQPLDFGEAYSIYLYSP